jgi:acetylornithine deacetylase/succinyl-diaminopimelate desuccinylase-like protein
MKTTVVAETMALILCKRLGVPLKGDLVVVAGADEESGGAYGFAWLAERYPEKLRADVAINEGGGGALHRAGRVTYPINTGEKGRLEVRITVTGRGYHASQPWMADNAIYKAQAVLDRIAAYQPEVSTEAELFSHLGDAIGIAEPITANTIDGIIQRIEETDVELASRLRAASRMTIVASMIKAGVKSNSVAETCLITCDVRTLPWQDEAYLGRELDKVLDGLKDVRYEILTTAVPSASPYDPTFVEQIGRATRAAVDRDDLGFIPGLTIGFTDSRLVRHLGITTYGFTPAHPDSDPSLDGAHNINESASIEDLMVMLRMFVALAWEVAADHR